MPISIRTQQKKTSPNYSKPKYGNYVDIGFKVLGVMAAMGVVLCLWLAARRQGGTDPKVVKAATMRLLVGSYDALNGLKERPENEADAFEALYKIAKCSECDGSGVIDKDGEEVMCPACRGVGVSRQIGQGDRFRNAFLEPAKCSRCDGTGDAGHVQCKECNGKGFRKDVVDQLLRDLSNGILKDTWGNRIKIVVDTSGKQPQYTIISNGPNSKSSRDDIEYKGSGTP